MPNRLSGLLEAPVEPEANRLSGLVQDTGAEDEAIAQGAEVARRAQVRSDALDKIIFSTGDAEFDVFQQGEIAQELDTWLENPSEFRVDETNKIILAETFGLSINDVNIMDKDMIKKLYGEETKDVAKRLKSNPFEGGYLKKMGESVKRGNKGISMNVAFYEALFNDKGDWQQLMETQDKVELDQLLSPIEGNRVTDLFYSSAQIAPGMVRGFWDAIPEAVYGAAIGATGAIVAGQLGPQALTLADEAKTVPTATKKGFQVGLKVGAFEFWYKQGAGQMAHSMLKNEVPEDIAKNIAGIAAIPYALIELSQATKLTPGLRKQATNKVGKSITGVVKRAVKKYGTTFTQEVWEEVQQEALAIAAEDVAKILAEQGLETVPGAGLVDLERVIDVVGDLGGEITADFLKKRGIRLFDTTKEAAKGMALLPGPGFGIDVTTGVAGVISDAKKAEINANLPDILSLAPERAELEAAKAGQELIANTTDKEAKPLEAKQEGVEDLLETKVVDEKGEPLTVFHGTNAKFDEFKIGRSPLAPGNIEGAFFTSDIEEAKEFGKNVIPVKLDFKNPFVGKIGDITEFYADKHGIKKPDFGQKGFGMTEADWVEYRKITPDVTKDFLIEQGFDSVIQEHRDGSKEYIAFEPEQIKRIVEAPTPQAKAEGEAKQEGVVEQTKAEFVEVFAAGREEAGFDRESSLELAEKRFAELESEKPVQPKHAGDVGSEEFKQWFGDSKVVGTDGKPTVLYHGTSNSAAIIKDGFKEGWTYLTDSKEVADSYQEWVKGDSPGTISVYAKAENPAYFDAEGQKYTEIGHKIFRAADDAMRAGHDAFIINNVRDNFDSSVETTPHTTVIAFSPSQIKVSQEAISPTPAAEGVTEEKRIISTEAFEAAKARIKERRKRLTAGIDPGDLVDAVVIGGYFFESGVRKFGTWSADMVKEFGKDIKPHLNKIWLDVTGAKEGDDFSDFFDFLEEDLPEIEKVKINKAKPLSEVKKDALQDVLNDEVFQAESEAADIRKREVDAGFFFVPKKFRGEVRAAIESDPSLRFNITFKKGEGTPFDLAIQEGFLTREGDATDKFLRRNDRKVKLVVFPKSS
jgi:hypothetical protein